MMMMMMLTSQSYRSHCIYREMVQIAQRRCNPVRYGLYLYKYIYIMHIYHTAYVHPSVEIHVWLRRRYTMQVLPDALVCGIR